MSSISNHLTKVKLLVALIAIMLTAVMFAIHTPKVTRTIKPDLVVYLNDQTRSILVNVAGPRPYSFVMEVQNAG